MTKATAQSSTHVKCIVPFILLSVHYKGYCYSCCPTWTKVGSVGRLTDHNSIMKIWNNAKMQRIRQAVLSDELEKVCDFKYCPNAIKNEYLALNTMKKDDQNFNHIIDQIMAGQTIMDKPPHIFSVSNSGKCNLKCVMCVSNDKFLNDEELLDEKLYTKIIPEILPDISRLCLSGNGEVLFNQNSRKFLQSLDSKSYPSLKIQLMTNATMFTNKLWESISQNCYESISVSIDGASQETYERIRKNGNWNILQKNLNLISKLRRQNVFESFRINFIVMKSNYKEMKDFVDLGLKLGCDKIIFQKIFGYSDIRENINFTHNKEIFIEIAKILDDPIFNHPNVDTTLIDEYRKYSDQRITFWNRLVTKERGVFTYFPVMRVFRQK